MKRESVEARLPAGMRLAGMRLAALLPATVHEPINRALRDNGFDIDISKIKPENLEDLGARKKVRVFCE
jgi:hypothetical protein